MNHLFLGYRHLHVLLIFWALFIAFTMRVSMSVAIVAMTDNSTSSNPDVPTFDWENKGVILSSFFLGNMIPQVLAGEMAKTLGTRYLLIASTLTTIISFGLVPLAAMKIGSYGVIVLRIITGLATGFTEPCVYDLLGRWIPSTERARLAGIALGGATCGTIVSNAFGGWLSSTSWGWPAIFYIFSSIGVVWIIIWFFFGAADPSTHPSISPEEREYIQTNLGNAGEVLKTPWKGLLTSIPLWALVVMNVGYTWVYIVLLTETPTYLSEVIGIDIKSNGILSALPYVGIFTVNIISSQIADYCINHKILSVGTTRKVMTTIASIGSSIFMLTLSFLPKEAKTASVVMLIFSTVSNGAHFAGKQVNNIDLSPRFAGITAAISNSLGVLFSLLAPVIVQVVIKDETDKSEWKAIFISAAILYLAVDVIYVIFGSGEVQPWNDPKIKARKVPLGTKAVSV